MGALEDDLTEYHRMRDRDAKIERLERELAGEREGREKLAECLRQKDAAMGVLFARLAEAGVDCSYLIP